MHCVVYTGIVPIVICILYQVHTDLQSEKVTLGQPPSLSTHSPISVVQVFQPRFKVNQ